MGNGDQLRRFSDSLFPIPYSLDKRISYLVRTATEILAAIALATLTNA